MKKFKKLLCIALTICLLAVCTISVAQAATKSDLKDTAANREDSEIQGNTILHCFDWSYKAITDNLDKIAEAGYTAVQTSPVQPPKDYSANWLDTSGQWWKMYQPIDITIAQQGQSWLGTEDDLKTLCQTADQYNIKVICDIVANHMANISGNQNKMEDISLQVNETLRTNSDYWHINNIQASDSSRYNMTMGTIGMPDLNTGNSYIQQRFKDLLTQLIEDGVDGFRFDAAKHIELPTDSGNSSDFWPVVINGSQQSSDKPIFYYGEILNSAGTDIEEYTQYMEVTDNKASDRSLVAANNSSAKNLSRSDYIIADNADEAVLWVESHDTYMGNSGSQGLSNTKNVSDATITKAWAITGARADSTALFFARPNSTMGKASTNTTWYSKPIAEINKFKKEFNGQSETLSYSGKVTYIERGTTGVSIAKLDGSGDVSLTAKAMQDGTYTDQITGNTFTVSDGVISGTVGDSGVAIVYNTSEIPTPKPTMTVSNTGGKFTDTLTITAALTGSSTLGSYKVGSNPAVEFTGSTSFTIGSDVNLGDVVSVVYTATDGNSKTTYLYEYYKVDPNYNPFTFPTERTVYLLDTARWGTAKCYAWIKNTTTSNAIWPGVPIEKVGEYNGYDVYSYDVPEEFNMVIFDDGDSQTPDLAFRENSYYDNSIKKWVTVENPLLLLGDADLNGNVNILDVTHIQRHLSYLETLNTKQLRVSNVDGNKSVNINDVTLIQKYLSNYDVDYDIGKAIIDP